MFVFLSVILQKLFEQMVYCTFKSKIILNKSCTSNQQIYRPYVIGVRHEDLGQWLERSAARGLLYPQSG